MFLYQILCCTYEWTSHRRIFQGCLNSSDNIRHVQDPVIIEPNYFSHPHDVAVLVRAIKDSLLIGHSSHFKQFGAQFYDKPLDQCSQVLHYLLEQCLQALHYLLEQCLQELHINLQSNLTDNAYTTSVFYQCSQVLHINLRSNAHRYSILPFRALFSVLHMPSGTKLTHTAYFLLGHCSKILHNTS